MRKHWIVGASLLTLAACEKPATREGQNTDQTQREAVEKANRAQAESRDKAMTAQGEANEKAAQAQGEANRDMAKEQAKSNENIREANQDVVKARNDYEVRTQKSVNEIDNKIDQLKVKAQTAKPKSKDDFVVAMRDVESRRAALDTDFRALRDQPDRFDSIRAKLDREITDLKKSVDAAQGKL
jgi:hypothetical protein